MKRLAMSAVLSLMAMLVVGASSADAGLGWCRRDPIVVLGGVRVQVIVAIPQEYEPNVTGPVLVEVATPAAVSRELVFTDIGFNGHGEEVYWADLVDGGDADGFPIAISISVPTDLPFSIPMEVDVVPDIGSPATVGGENIGLTVAAWVAGSTVRTESVHGADDIATNPGEAAVGASAVGASVIGASVMSVTTGVDQILD